MELSAEGLAAAAATREALATKKRQLEELQLIKQELSHSEPPNNTSGSNAGGAAAAAPGSKRPGAPMSSASAATAAAAAAAAKKPHLNRPPPACTHEVAIPIGFDLTSIKHDEAVHGEWTCRLVTPMQGWCMVSATVAWSSHALVVYSEPQLCLIPLVEGVGATVVTSPPQSAAPFLPGHITIYDNITAAPLHTIPLEPPWIPFHNHNFP